ncbi:HPP family-domain-containing protein [Obelidium mucronatum]|nr:HPP family-domain-containing protein [Obelidium mucronatum]
MTAFLTSNSNIPESSQQSIGMSKSYKDSLVRYFLKWKGQDSGPTDSRPTQPTFQTTCTSTLITFISLVITAYVNQSTEFINGPLTETGSLLIGSLGATAVLLYHAIDSPLAQPSNLFWGHLISAFIGVSTSKVFDLEALHPHKLTLAVPVGVALAIFAMGLTNTMHPPGGCDSFPCDFWKR